jgi:putative ABC transport system permease protein
MKRLLRSWLWRVPVDQEVDEEIAFHLEMRTRDLIARGMPPEAARELARRRMGDLERLKQDCLDLGRKRDRKMKMLQLFEEFRTDVRFALRQMRHAPGFTTVAIATLALGIGANAAIFALVDATLLRPLPFPDADRLVSLSERVNGGRDMVSPINMLDWNERSRSVERIGGFTPSVGGMVMAGKDGTSETVPRQWVLPGFFDALGVTPVAGRTFVRDDEAPRARVVVLTEGFWRSRFGGDPSIVGRDLRLDGEPFTVVGVVPDTAQIFGRTSMWALRTIPRRADLRGLHMFEAVGRLKPGVTLEAARADMSGVADGLAREFPKTNKDRGVDVTPLHDALIGTELRLTSLLFLGVVGFVLLICCANVANLLLARATVRTRELAVRSALGAGRSRVLRQLVTESLVLSTIGGLLGIGLGALLLDGAPAVIPEGLLPVSVTLTFDWRVVAFCAATAVLVGLLFGLAPAARAAELPGVQSMGTATRTSTGRGGIRSLLVGAEVATAVLLLVGAGLLLRTLLAVEGIDRGYRAEQVLTMMIDPLGAKYPTDAELLQFFDQVEQEIRAVPGVRSVAYASTLPYGDSTAGDYLFDIVGDPVVAEAQRPAADYQIVSHTYFETVDLPILAGRGFTDRDTSSSPQVCIVNEAFVRRHLQGRSPIGAQLAMRSAASPEDEPTVRQIVGVVRQIKGRPDEKEDLRQIYVPMAQSLMDDMFLVVRPKSAGLQGFAASVRAAIARVDKEQLVSIRDVMTLEDLARKATSRHRFRAVLVVTFAALALALAMVGLFGILAYSVQQRVREFGVRRALGAATGDIVRLVAVSASRVIVAGAVVGLVLASLLSRLLTSVLFGVKPLDPATFASVVAVLVVTALIAVAWPAWRAVRIDPAAALRND